MIDEVNEKDNIFDNNKLALDLSLHRYDEEERRNQLIDEKNSSLIAFLGVMLTIQCTLIPSIMDLFGKFICVPVLEILVVCYIISLAGYVVAMFYFISALTFSEFHSVPDVPSLIEFKDNEKIIDIMNNNIISLNKAIMENKKIMDLKTLKGKNGFCFLKVGIVFLVIFITIFLRILFW